MCCVILKIVRFISVTSSTIAIAQLICTPLIRSAINKEMELNGTKFSVPFINWVCKLGLIERML